jgi:hypothetical protein
MTHAHDPAGGRTLARGLGRKMTDGHALDTIQQVIATESLDAVALDRIVDLVKATGRDAHYRDDGECGCWNAIQLGHCIHTV